MHSRLLVVAALICLVWVVSIFGFIYPDIKINLALIPRSSAQWWGIFTSAFVHQNFSHLIANTVPLAIFLSLLLPKNRNLFYACLPLCIFLGGGGLWLFGREGAHLGASGLVFAFFGLLIANAFFARRGTDIAIALGVVLAYWGLINGVLPTDPNISWDGHLFGVIGGIMTSWLVAYLPEKAADV